MDVPTPHSDHAGLDRQAGSLAAQPAADVIQGPERTPAGVLARPVVGVSQAAPVHSGEAVGREAGVDLETLITEDDTPVDNMPSEKQQRLLTEPLYSSWAGPGAGRRFLAAANVGVFPEPRNPAIVPDVFLSLDVQVADNWWDKRHRSYFVWEFGKPPDLVVEIVSNRKGEEVGRKRRRYARMGVRYYVTHDPLHRVMREDLRVYRLSDGGYARQESPRFPELRLGMTLWEGEFEGVRSRWLRWTDEHDVLIPLGKERAEQERRRAEHAEHVMVEERRRAERERGRAEQERGRAEQERRRAEHAEHVMVEERRRAERLAALLRRSGIDPEQG